MVFNCYGIAPIDIFIYSHGDLVSVLVIIQASPYEYAQGNPGVIIIQTSDVLLETARH